MTVTAVEYVLRSIEPSWNYTSWEQLPDDGNRYEVIDGVLYMTTAPSNFHQWIIQRLIRFVGIPAEDTDLAYSAIAPIGLLMPGCDPVQPDFLLIRKEHAGIIVDRRIRGVPDLIVEVLSPSNPEQDTEIKRSVYARAGLPEYWIVRPQTRDVLVCWQPEPDLGIFTQVQRVASTSTLTSPTMPSISFVVANLFAGAPDTTL
jgi:Uma2 family endonuclease